jgi:hypothetical protein
MTPLWFVADGGSSSSQPGSRVGARARFVPHSSQIWRGGTFATQSTVQITRSVPARAAVSIVCLTAGAGVTRAVTKHLHVLGGAGLVRGACAGRDHVWQIELVRRRSDPLARTIHERTHQRPRGLQRALG